MFQVGPSGRQDHLGFGENTAFGQRVGLGEGDPGQGTKNRLTCCCRVAAGFREPESRVQQGNSRDARCLISEREPCAKDSASSVGVLEGSVSEVIESILVADGEM